MDRDSNREASKPTTAPRLQSGLSSVSPWLAALALLTAGGCTIPAPFTRNDNIGPSLPANASAEEVVRRVNTNIDRLWAWRSNAVRISGPSLPVHLGGQIAVERPRNFRLTAGILGMDEEADFGSNTDSFWFWVKRANAHGEPSYVYQARHEDVANSQMLSQIPFQPDWLMEALGVVPIDAHQLTLHPEPGGQYVNLISERLSPSGQTVKKVIRVDLHRGVVLSHSLHDIDGKLIARARLDQHFRDKQTGIVMPHLIALEWPQANLKINLEIDQIDVNPTTIPPRNWQVPKKDPYYPAFDIGALSRKHIQMADGASVLGGQIGQPRQVGQVDTASGAVSAPTDVPLQFGAPSPLAGPGRSAVGAGKNSDQWPEANGASEWNQPMQSPSGALPGRVRVDASPFDGDPVVTGANATPSSPSKRPTPNDPFGDPPPGLETQAPARPGPLSPGSNSSGSNSGDPFR
jgi:hypothetical protein